MAKQNQSETMSNIEKLTILPLAGTNTLVIRKQDNSTIFLTTPDSVIINIDTFIILINAMIKKEILNKKLIEGMLEEAHTE